MSYRTDASTYRKMAEDLAWWPEAQGAPRAEPITDPRVDAAIFGQRDEFTSALTPSLDPHEHRRMTIVSKKYV